MQSTTSPSPRIRTNWLSALGLIFLAGCAANGPAFTKATPPNEGQSLIYIYRDESKASSARDVHISIDRTDVADLSTNGYTVLYAPPGKHKLAWRWPLLDVPFISGKVEWSRTWLAGHTYYYRFGVSYEGPYAFKDSLVEMTEESALTEMSQTKFQPPKNVAELNKPSASTKQ